MQIEKTPPRVLGLYDQPMWDMLKETNALHLQCCSDCDTWRYPPGPVCPDCLSPNSYWKAVSGAGEIMSWIMFQKHYLPEYPAPYNVIAVKLAEGPILISNLTEDPDETDLIGRKVRLTVVNMKDGVALPRFVLEG